MTLQDNGTDGPALDAVDSVEDDIRAAMAQLSADDTPDAVETTQADRDRDERGRFAARAGEDTPAPEIAGTPEPKDASKDTILAAPEGWPADATTKWDKLSRPVQDAIRADLAAGKFSLGGASGDANNDPIRQAAHAYEADAKAVGVDLADYTRNTLGWARSLASDPEGTLRQLAGALGVDLSRLTSTNAAPSAAPSITAPPEVAALQRELEGFKTQMRQQQERSVQAEIDAWAGEKDAQGNPMRPHFSALEEAAFAHRIALVRQQNPGLAAREVLQRAYDAEVYAQERTRNLMLESVRTAEAQKRADEAKRATAEAARRRSVSVTGSHSPMNATDDAGDETVEQTIRRLMSDSR